MACAVGDLTVKMTIIEGFSAFGAVKAPAFFGNK
jgi:hypothetical protein